MEAEKAAKISFLVPAAFSAALIAVQLLPMLKGGVHANAGTANAFALSTPKPSFNCEKVTNVSALAICQDANLAKLDAQMGDLYGPLVRANPDLRKDQRAWIRQRNAECGANVDCLQRSLASRVDALKKLDPSP